jgi:hypothetical protein
MSVDYTSLDRLPRVKVEDLPLMPAVKPPKDVMDDVNSPAHYIKNGFEVIDIIEAFRLNYQLGNVVKYVLRHQEKGNPLKDLKKARWYINREIENMEKQKDVSTF